MRIDWDSRGPDADEVVDGALRAAVLEEVPAGFHARVMERVRAHAPLPAFRVSWLDVVLSLFASGMAVLGLLVVQALPEEIALRLRLEELYWVEWLRLEGPGVLWPLLVGGALAGALLAGLWVALGQAIERAE